MGFYARLGMAVARHLARSASVVLAPPAAWVKPRTKAKKRKQRQRKPAKEDKE